MGQKMRALKLSEARAELEAGDTIMLDLPRSQTVEEPQYFLVNRGRRITPTTFAKLEPELRPLRGLFELTPPQQWELAR